MKFSCEKALLQNAILTASRAVSPKSTIPALEGLLLEAEDSGTVFLTGYNQETGIRSAIQADVTEAGSMVLSARLFGEIVRKMPDDTLLFQEEALKVHIACGMSEFDLMGIDPEDFPELPTVEYQNSLSIPEQTLRAMIGQTLFAVSDDESRPVHTGSLFVVDEEGLTMVAVDGFRLALRREPVAEKNGTFEFVVPGASLSEVEKICRETDELVGIHQGARHILFKIGSTILISRRLEGEFLAWRQAIPRNNPIKVTANTKQLLACIDRVSLIVSEKLKSPLRCVIGEGEIDMTTKTALGNAHDCCPVGGQRKRPGDRVQQQVHDGCPEGGSQRSSDPGAVQPHHPCIIVPAEGGGEFPVHGPPRPPQSRFLSKITASYFASPFPPCFLLPKGTRPAGGRAVTSVSTRGPQARYQVRSTSFPTPPHQSGSPRGRTSSLWGSFPHFFPRNGAPAG